MTFITHHTNTLALLAVLIASPQSLISQTSVGIQPFGSYQATPVDQINLATLNVRVDIPLFVHKARGANNGTSLHLIYDGGAWNIQGGTAEGGGLTIIQDSSNTARSVISGNMKAIILLTPFNL